MSVIVKKLMICHVIRSIEKLKSEISYRNSQESVQKSIEDYINMIE